MSKQPDSGDAMLKSLELYAQMQERRDRERAEDLQRQLVARLSDDDQHAIKEGRARLLICERNGRYAVHAVPVDAVKP